MNRSVLDRSAPRPRPVEAAPRLRDDTPRRCPVPARTSAKPCKPWLPDSPHDCSTPAHWLTYGLLQASDHGKWTTLFTFLRNPAIDATSWRAEQAIRCHSSRRRHPHMRAQSLVGAILTARQKRAVARWTVVDSPVRQSVVGRPKLTKAFTDRLQDARTYIRVLYCLALPSCELSTYSHRRPA